MPPPALQPIEVGTVRSLVRAVGLHRVEGTGTRGEVLPHPLEVVPVGLALLVVVLRDVDEGVPIGMIEGASMLRALQIVVVPHLGHVGGHAGTGRAGADEVGPVGPPRLVTRGLVVDAVEHVRLRQRAGEHGVGEALLHGQQRRDVALRRRAVEEGLLVGARMVRVIAGESRRLGGVGARVGRIVGMRRPVVAEVVEAVPQLDLHDDVAGSGEGQQPVEARPVLGVPLRQVPGAIGQACEGVDLEATVRPVAHRVADVVGTRGPHLVEMRLQIGDLEQVVVLAAAQEQDRRALVLPVPGIARPGSDASGRDRRLRGRVRVAGAGPGDRCRHEGTGARQQISA